MSHLPAIVAARATLIFPKVRDKSEMESFFREISLSLFDSCATRGYLIGHVKLYGEGSRSSVIRANATGRRESVGVVVRDSRPEKQVKIWVNVIAYKRSREELKSSLLSTLARIQEKGGITVRGLTVVRGHENC